MKRIALTALVSIFCIISILAQTPQGFNYQTVLHGNDEIILPDKTVNLKFSIIQNSPSGDVVYAEWHSATTNSLGLISLKIGEGNDLSGDFSAINWSLGQYYLKVELDLLEGEESFVIGTTELISVPFALHAQTATEIDDADADPNNELQTLLLDGDSLGISDGNKVKIPTGSSKWQSSGNDIYYNGGKVGIGTEAPATKLVVKGDESTVSNDLLFAVVNNADDTVFAVFQGGVRINVDDNITKAVGNKGGFAVGGFNSGKGLTNEYLRVTRDSTRIYVDDTDTKAVGNKGGFAVGGFNSGKGDVSNFLDLTKDNYFIGHEAGKSNTEGLFNSFIGYKAGFNNTTGLRNTFLGYYSGFSNTVGNTNIFIGDSSGYFNETGFYNVFIGNNAGTGNLSGYSNVFVGNKSGSNNIDGKWNVFVGHKTGHFNTTGTGNVFVGSTCGYYNTTGINNVFVGDWCGNFNTTGFANVFIGNRAGWNNIDGNTNVFIGDVAGFNNTTGSQNVFMGCQAGYSNTEGSSNVFLGFYSGHTFKSGYDNIFLGHGSGFSSDTCSSNVFIGNQSGYSNENGNNNIFMGTEAGWNNTEGNNNIFMGSIAGHSNTTGYNNVFIGNESGVSNIDSKYNVFLGSKTGHSNTSGSRNVFIGGSSGFSNTTGLNNVFVGNWCGNYNTTGYSNVFLGNQAGWNNIDGNTNVFIGDVSGFNNTTGYSNIFLGTESGHLNISGSENLYLGYHAGRNGTAGIGNVFIGRYAGLNEQNSDRLIIETSDADENGALIYGEFDIDYLRFNARVGIGARAEYDANLTLRDTTRSAALKIRGTGDTYNYSKILLESEEEVNKFWQLGHSKTNDFSLVFNDGTNFLSRLQIFANGGAKILLGGLEVDSTITANKIESKGGFVANLISISNNYTVKNNDYTILSSTSSADITVNLPAAASVINQIFIIKKIDSNVNDVIIDPAGTELIDSNSNISLSNQNDAITIQSDGLNWYIIGGNY